uniref:Uncharacterized protein n=1 Tax=Lygus hesperus TaxID=30085 RepID=A0A146KY43_LYGHE
MKALTVLLCLAGAVATVNTSSLSSVMASPTESEDPELTEQWSQHKDAIMLRLEENDANLKRQYKEQLEKIESSSGEEKESAQQRADSLKQEIVKSELVISRLKNV